ncbi:MAG TPA: DUF5329 family protein [Thermoanaerobaculia bacterium]|jgi:hypothetical protein
MKKRKIPLLLLLLLAFVSPVPTGISAAAETRPAAEQAKIDRLLEEMRSSGAVFIRNGKEYDGEKAAGHLKAKLWWAGRKVQTARDFILGVASRSEESGRIYEIRLKDGPTKPLQAWLLERLDAIEKSNG